MDGADSTAERIRIGARIQTPAVLIYVAVWLTASALLGFQLTSGDLSPLPLGINLVLSLVGLGLLVGSLLWINTGHYAWYSEETGALSKGRTELHPRDVQALALRINIAVDGQYALLRLTGRRRRITLKLAGTGRTASSPQAAHALQRFLDRTAEEKNLGDIPRGTIQAHQQLLAAEAGAVNAWHPVSPVVAEKFVRTTLLNHPGAGGDRPGDPELDQLNRKYLSDESSAQEHMAQVRRSAWPEALLIAAGLGFTGGAAGVAGAAIMDSAAWGIPGMLALAAGGLLLWGWSIGGALRTRRYREAAVEWFQSQDADTQRLGMPPVLQAHWTRPVGGAWIGLVVIGCSLGGVSLLIGVLLLLTADDQELRGIGWLLCLLGGILVPGGIVAITRWATSRSRAAAALAPYSGI
ncbi:hypothetical protein [Nesterenkonia muleiensis]|uniref:hypothetical protein n=1 Tax=Nesterenkonia muleiensis TaxID=2282648 RepID=UPI000E7654D9|nr:hypothetical protein [Nesterenkonia muleiensis]